MLKQVEVRYDKVEDRLLLGVTASTPSGNDVEHWLHLTRRVCEAWRVGLQAMLDMSAQAPQTLPPQTRSDLAREHHAAQLTQAPRKRPTEAQPMTRRAPVLVKRVECGRSRSDGRWVMTMVMNQGPELQLRLDTPTMHAMVELIMQKISKSGWALPPLAREAAEGDGHKARTSVLH